MQPGSKVIFRQNKIHPDIVSVDLKVSWKSDKQNLKLISINDVVYNLLNVRTLYWQGVIQRKGNFLFKKTNLSL